MVQQRPTPVVVQQAAPVVVQRGYAYDPYPCYGYGYGCGYRRPYGCYGGYGGYGYGCRRGYDAAVCGGLAGGLLLGAALGGL